MLATSPGTTSPETAATGPHCMLPAGMQSRLYLAMTSHVVPAAALVSRKSPSSTPVTVQRALVPRALMTVIGESAPHAKNGSPVNGSLPPLGAAQRSPLPVISFVTDVRAS